MVEKKSPCTKGCHGLFILMYRISNPKGKGTQVDTATLMTMPCAGSQSMDPGCRIPEEEKYVTYEIALAGENNYIIQKKRLDEKVGEITADFDFGTLGEPTRFFHDIENEFVGEMANSRGRDLEETYRSQRYASERFVEYLRKLF